MRAREMVRWVNGLLFQHGVSMVFQIQICSTYIKTWMRQCMSVIPALGEIKTDRSCGLIGPAIKLKWEALGSVRDPVSKNSMKDD